MRRGLPLLSLVLAGCATTPTPTPTQAPPSASLHWVLTAAEYRAAFLQTYRVAAAVLERLAAGRAPGTWAVSLDGDETVISNAPYERELAASGATHSPAGWSAWVARQAAQPLPGAVEFLRRVHQLGGRVAIVTNRGHADCPPTEENFRREGIPFDVMLCRPEVGSSEKEPRWEALAQGTAAPGLPPVEILLWLGDNVGDFPDLDQDAGRDPERLEEFGRRYFVFPNPVYGSWQRNPVE
jgi:5'-nucleotidase (lipoprotein e(P4) family)